MTDIAANPVGAKPLIEARPAPVQTTGLAGFLRTRLFNTPGNILLTLVCVLLLWFTIIPTVKFLFTDAVWTGSDRNACLSETVGRTVGACWPYVQAKIGQFVYGFYPQEQRWRVNLTLVIGVVLLVPLLIPRVPAKTLNYGLMFLAFPVIGFFLLRGGGIDGFAISWFSAMLNGFAESLESAGRVLAGEGNGGLLSSIAWLVGSVIGFIGNALGYLFSPLGLLTTAFKHSSSPIWYDFGVTAAIVSLALYFLGGAGRTSLRLLIGSLVTFGLMALVIKLMRLDAGGLPLVDTRQWGGLLVTLVVSVSGIAASLPVGVMLALGRRSSIPLIRLFSIAFIEFWRGVPLITVLFFATYMLPLFLPGNFTIDGLVRVLIGIALFSGAYVAEIIRGGLQAVPRGQYEAAAALGLNYVRSTSLIIMPQALRHVIPGLVNNFIALLKDTSLVSIVAIFDLLGQLRASFADPAWATPTTLFTGFAFTGIIYFVLCFGMSRYSVFVERRLNAFRRT